MKTEWLKSDFKAAHIKTLMGWFNNESDLRQWSGPFFQYPFTELSFREDLTLDRYLTQSILTQDGELAAFGQCYLRLERLHLARLAVSPSLRGQGVISVLIEALIVSGKQKFGQRGQSLFVLADNQKAISAYQKLGFQSEIYPQKMEIENCLYMIRSEGIHA